MACVTSQEAIFRFRTHLFAAEVKNGMLFLERSLKDRRHIFIIWWRPREVSHPHNPRVADMTGMHFGKIPRLHFVLHSFTLPGLLLVDPYQKKERIKTYPDIINSYVWTLLSIVGSRLQIKAQRSV